MAAAGTTAMAALYLAPRKHIPVISYVGASGFTIYLLHGLVLQILRHYGLTMSADEYRAWKFPLLVLQGFVLALILCSAPVRRLAQPLVRPNANWLFKPEPPPERRVGVANLDRSSEEPEDS